MLWILILWNLLLRILCSGPDAVVPGASGLILVLWAQLL